MKFESSPNKQEQIQRIIDSLRDRESSRLPANFDSQELAGDIDNLGHSFSNRLLKAATGHSTLTYSFREDSSRSEEFKSLPYEFKYDEKKIDPALETFLKSKFAHEMVLDLGAGTDGDGYALADALGADGYIGDEFNFAGTLAERCERIKGSTPFVIVPEDMGLFLDEFKKFGFKPSVVMFSGIDRYSYNGEDPFPVLLQKIADTMDENSILAWGGNFGYMEDDYGKSFSDLFEEIKGDWDYDRTAFFKKRSTG